MTKTATLTIDRDHSHGYPGFKAIVRLAAGTSVSYGHRTYTAARLAGEQRMAQEPAAQSATGAMSFRVQPVGRAL
jgi:hypothetical protein